MATNSGNYKSPWTTITRARTSAAHDNVWKTWKIHPTGSQEKIQECLERSQGIPSSRMKKSKVKVKSQKSRVVLQEQIAENQAVCTQLEQHLSSEKTKARFLRWIECDRYLRSTTVEWQQQNSRNSANPSSWKNQQACKFNCELNRRKLPNPLPKCQ